MILLPVRIPILSSTLRTSPLIVRVDGILPSSLTFIYEHTFYNKGKITENGESGVSFIVVLYDFLLGKISSIEVGIDKSSGGMVGGGKLGKMAE